MSEYILDYELIPLKWRDGYGLSDVDLTEEIVRCRDCRHYNPYHGKCHRPLYGIFIDEHGLRRIEDVPDLIMAIDTEPDGFCWGARGGTMSSQINYLEAAKSAVAETIGTHPFEYMQTWALLSIAYSLVHIAEALDRIGSESAREAE